MVVLEEMSGDHQNYWGSLFGNHECHIAQNLPVIHPVFVKMSSGPKLSTNPTYQSINQYCHP